MTTEQIIGLILSLLVMSVALLGSLVHVLPGATLIFGGDGAPAFTFGPTGTSTWVLILMAVIALLSMLIEVLASVIGARKLGATRRGMCGAVAGGLVGLFFSLPGLLLGPFLGAFLFERATGRPTRAAAKAGIGAVLGLWIGTLASFAFCLVMIALFIASVLVNSLANRSAETLTWMGDASQVGGGVPVKNPTKLKPMKHLLTILAAGTALAGLAGLTALSVLVLLVIPVGLGILTIEFARFKNRLRRMGGWRRRTGLVLQPEIQP